MLRLYDNVPRVAKAQTIQGNRLMYGNYVDGYDVQAIEGGSDIRIDYQANPYSKPFSDKVIFTADSSNLTQGDYNISGALHQEADSVIEFEMADVAVGTAPIPQGTNVIIGLQLNQTTATDCNDSGTSSQCSNASFQNSPFQISMTFTCPVQYNTVSDMLQSTEFKNRIGGSTADGFTGTSIVASEGTQYLVKNLITSLIFAVISIGILMAILFRSWRMVVISMIWDRF